MYSPFSHTVIASFDHLVLCILHTSHAKLYHEYLIRNKTYLAPFSPKREQSYAEISEILARIPEHPHAIQHNKQISFVLIDSHLEQIVWDIHFTGFIFGVFQACYLGFALDQHAQGNNWMYQALSHAISYVQTQSQIHRIMANHLPDNLKSARLLQRLGFEPEGYAKAYLKINGQWQDHVLTALVFDETP